MKMALVGIGAAGIVSTVACTLFLPGQEPFEMADLVDTCLLLGLGWSDSRGWARGHGADGPITETGSVGIGDRLGPELPQVRGLHAQEEELLSRVRG